jgi:PAS domain S-box-containing protein
VIVGPAVDAAIDTSNCETEPLRFPGAVQPHGAVLILRAGTAMIEAASESCEALLGYPAERLLGTVLHDIIGAGAATALLGYRCSGLEPLVHVSVNGRDLRARPCINQAQQISIDFESVDRDFTPILGTAYHHRRVLAELRRSSDVPLIAQQTAAMIRDITEFDRVMIYRFDADWNGEVIGEACVDTIDPYLGMHFPASDIPKQARELYASGRIRHIPNAGYVPSVMVTRGDPHAIDLGSSTLRSVSPMHREYLRNMQVHSTLVGSLVIEGRLWGLVSCQHKSGPKHVDPSVRDGIEWLCEDFAAALEAAIIRQRGERERSLSQRRRRLVDELRGADLKELMSRNDGAGLLTLVDADGFALLAKGSIHTMGITPTSDRIELLQRRRLDCGNDSTLFASSALARDLAVDESDGTAGALFVSLRKGPDITMIWFRNERRFCTRWGGDPQRMRLVDETGRFSPRKSFAQYEQQTRGQCLPWTTEELASAADLGSLIEIEELKQSEAFAKSIMDSSPKPTAVLDARGVIMSANRAWDGVGAANLPRYGVTDSSRLHYRSVCAAAVGRPNDTNAAQAWSGIEAVLHGAKTYFTLDYPCDFLEARRWIRLSAYPMIAPGEGAVVVHEDITERKLTALRLEYERTQLRTLLQTIPDMVWLKDPSGAYLTCNPAYERLIGAMGQHLIGKTDYAFMTVGQADVIREQELEVKMSIVSKRKERWVIDGEANRVLLEVTITPMLGANGSLLGVLSVGRDITELRRSEGELEQHRHHLEKLVDERTAALAIAHAAAEAEHHATAERLRVENEVKMRSSKLQAVGTLAAGIAHDFNNILGSIVGFAEMTADELPDDSDAKRNVEQILSGSFRARDLVARMLTFARASPVEPAEVDIVAVVEEALALLRASVRASIEMIFDNKLADLTTSVLADPTQIMQIVMNLCINSVHAIDNRGTITVGLEPADQVDLAPTELRDGVCLTVTDTGSGITSEVRERLFDPFFTTKAPGEGSGLGLSVVYGIVSAMGGVIKIDSSTAAVGSGTRFQLFLPRFTPPSESGQVPRVND